MEELDSKRDTHFLMLFFCVGYFYPLHFEQRHQERKRRFCSLVFIDAIWMKPSLQPPVVAS